MKSSRTLWIAAVGLTGLLAPSMSHANQAIDYLSGQAQVAAGQVRRASEFTKMDSYHFVKNFINYSGYQSLPAKLLGSKEFISRLQGVKKNGVYWSPGPDPRWIDRALDAAKAARKSVGAKGPKQARGGRS